MGEQIARDVGPTRIQMAWEAFGNPADPPVLLIMGAGAQMISWPEGFCDALVARHLRVIRFDNRDAGRSSHMTHLGVPDVRAGLAGDTSSVAYRLEDMADDTLGLLDALGIERANLVGASLGGQIAQIVACRKPARVASLVSMMSTTGRLEMPLARALRIFSLPEALTREQAMDNAVKVFELIGSPKYPFEESAVRDRAGRIWDRGHDTEGIARQSMAAIATGERKHLLHRIIAPTLVIHGTDDPMVRVDAGRATAAAIPRSRMVEIEGMGHNLPPGLWDTLADLIAGHVTRTQMASQ